MPTQFNILLADDDQDDRFFFARALKSVSIPTLLTTIEDGEKLMDYLLGDSLQPDAIFIDMNMPRKNGSECLKEIKSIDKLKEIPVIIYSTSLPEDVAERLYKDGAHYCIRKDSLTELGKSLHSILTLMVEKKFNRPPINQFISLVK